MKKSNRKYDTGYKFSSWKYDSGEMFDIPVDNTIDTVKKLLEIYLRGEKYLTESSDYNTANIFEIVRRLFYLEGYEVMDHESNSNEMDPSLIDIHYVLWKNGKYYGLLNFHEYYGKRNPLEKNDEHLRELLTDLPAIGKVIFIAENVSLRENEILNLAKQYEFNFQLKTRSDIISWIKQLDSIPFDDELRVIIKNFTKQLIELIIENPDYLLQIEWRDLERVLALLFSAIGFQVELTRPSKDGGKDLVLSCKLSSPKKTYVVEVKHWTSKKVGNKEATKLLNVVLKEDREKGILISTSGFSNNLAESLTEIGKSKLRFGDSSTVMALCKTFIKVREGLWSQDDDLSMIPFIHI